MKQLQDTVILTAGDIERLVDPALVIRVIKRAFVAQARGQVQMPPKVYLTLPTGGDFRAMPAYLGSPAAAGIKWVNVHPNNAAKGLPTVMGVVILSDPTTGFPLAIMDGLSITRLRTGASAAVAAQALATPSASVVALVGCGAQALDQLRMLAVVRRLRQVRVWGYRKGEAAAFCRRVQRSVSAALQPVDSIPQCVQDADVIVTITSSREPLVQREWVAPGAHINAMGADAPGKQELDPAILKSAMVVVDDTPQAVHGGELNVPIARGQYSPKDIHATLGEVLIGRRPGRQNDGAITVFDSTGIAVHDVALAAEVFRLAAKARVGRRVRLFR